MITTTLKITNVHTISDAVFTTNNISR